MSSELTSVGVEAPRSKRGPVADEVFADVAHDWRAFRAAFPTTSRFVYLDTANKALLPRWTEEGMRGYMADIYDSAGRAAFSMASVEEAREDIAAFVGAPPQCLALIKNTSEGMNIVANGLGGGEGDNVVFSEFEHENNTFPWRFLARKGIELRIVKSGPDGRVPLQAYRDVVDARTRIVSVAWVAYGNGFRSDIPALVEIAHRAGAKLVVDAIQAVGILDRRIDSLGADIVVSGGHKTLLSPAGAGIFYVRPDLLVDLEPAYAAKFSFSSLDRTIPDLRLSGDAHRFEYGNPNFLGIWLQRRSARILKQVGLKRIEARVRELTTRLMNGLERLPVTVLTPRPWEERAGIVSLRTAAAAKSVVARLRERSIILSEKDGFVRASIHAYNDESDIDTLLAVLPGVLKD